MQRYTELRYQSDVKGNREKGGEGDKGWRKEEGREEGAGTQNKTVSMPLVSAGQLICTDPKWGNINHSYL